MSPGGATKALALLAVGLGLTACATAPTAGTPPATDAAGTGAPARKPPAVAPAAAPVALPKPPLPLRPNLPADLQALNGLRTADVRAVMGEPTVLRQDIGAQVWQYFGRDCVLDLYLYRGDQAGWQVLHHHLRSTVPGQKPSRDCLQEPPRGLHPLLREG